MILPRLQVPQAGHFTCLCDHMRSCPGTLSLAVLCRLLNKVVGTRGLRLGVQR